MKNIFIYTIVLLLAGCGFHLRGEYVGNDIIGKFHIISDNPYSYFTSQLRQNISDNENATHYLHILDEKKSKNVTFVTMDAKIQQYILSFKVVYNIDDYIEDQITEQKTLTVTNSNLSSHVTDVEMLYTEMEKDAAYHLSKRLASKEIKQKINI